MVYFRSESSYTRIDPDGTFHRWENRLELSGSSFEVCQVLDHLSNRFVLPGLGGSKLLSSGNSLRLPSSSLDKLLDL